MKKLFFSLFILLFFGACNLVEATRYHVRTTGTMADDGLTWATSTTLANALVLAMPGDTIMVARGTYKPANMMSSFVMKDNLVFRGGYNNTGNPTYGSSNATTNPTILSGDILGNDDCTAMLTGTMTTYTDNCTHIITVPNTVTTTVTIDAFTLQGGYANGTTPNNRGGGMFINGAVEVLGKNLTFNCNAANSRGGAIENSTTDFLSLTNTCTFTQNFSVTADGGAIYSTSDRLTVTGATFTSNKSINGGAICVNVANPANCNYAIGGTFKTNTASGNGGAIYIQNGDNTGVQITGGYFEANTATIGGAIAYFGTAQQATSSISASKFMGNIATGRSGGAIAIDNFSITGNIFNNVFSGNQATGNTGTNGSGGAVAIENLAIVATVTQLAPAIYNNTFSRNSSAATGAAKGGGGLFISNCDATVVFNAFNNILWDNTASNVVKGNNLFVSNATSFILSNSIMNVAEGSCTGTCADATLTTLYNKNPQFYDFDGVDNILGNADDDLRLQYDATVVLPVTINNTFDLGVTTNTVSTSTKTSPTNDIQGFRRTCKPDLGAYEYLHYWGGLVSNDWNLGTNWSPRSGLVVPNKTMNIYIGIDNQNDIISTTNPTVSITPVLTTTNYEGFSLFVRNRLLMNTSSLITLQGDLVVSTNNGKFNPNPTYSGKVLMKPTDCNFAQNITHNGSECNFNYLEIDNAANVSKSGNNINVQTVVEMTNGNLAISGGFILLSTASYTAMVANDPAAGTAPTTRRITGNVTVQRYISGHPSGYTLSGYHYFCSPIANYTYNQFSVVTLSIGAGYYWYNYSYLAANFPNLFTYLEGNNADSGNNTGGFEGGASPMGGWRCPANLTDSPTTGQGFIVSVAAALTPTFRGTVQNGTIDIPITKTGSSAYSGWNLVGNPYPSPLDWDLAQAANTGIVEAALYRRIPKGALNIVTWSKYIPGTGSTVEGGTVGGTSPDNPTTVNKDIALGQGFFVVAKGNGNLSFTNAMRPTVATQTNPLFLRTENDKPMSVKFRFQSTEYYDEMMIHFKEKATENYDGDFDAYKAPSNAGTMPDAFMLSADKKMLSINGLPFSAMQKAIPFVVRSKTAGEYQIKIQELFGVPAGTNIILWDKELNKKQNLSLNPIYKFDAKITTYNTRFELIFDIGIDTDKIGNLMVYPNPVTDSKATLRLQTNKAATLQIIVYDTTGRIVKNLSANKELNTFEMPIDFSDLIAGVYVVEVTDEQGKYTAKFVR